MHRFSTTVAVAVLMLVFITGCGDSDPGNDDVDETEVLYIEPIGYGQSGSLTDSVEIAFRSEEEWAVYRDSLNPLAPFKSVDFEQGMVLLVALPQTTSGHTIDIVSVEVRDSAAVAEYLVEVPAEDCLTASAETVPFQAVMVRRIDLPVEFIHDAEEYRCTFGPRR